MIPICMSLSEETMSKVGHQAGASEIEGRDREVTNWINEIMPMMMSLDENFRFAASSFLLGYALRGYDNVCDFKISKGEIITSLLSTYAAMIGAITPGDGDDSVLDLKMAMTAILANVLLKGIGDDDD